MIRSLSHRMIAIILLLSIVHFSPRAATAQTMKATDQAVCGVRELTPERQSQIERTIRAFKQTTATSELPYTIPLYIHVISKGTSIGDGNITDAQLSEQLNVLEQSFAGTTLSAQTPFRFELRGITRTVNRTWFTARLNSRDERAMKTALRQGGANALNLYIANPISSVTILGLPAGPTGWANLPTDYASDPIMDGAVIDYSTVPGVLPYVPARLRLLSKAWDEGDTAVHEIGHWFGLYHTFTGACTEHNDNVLDTPREATPAYTCNVDRDSCPREAGTDPITNFMDYSPDLCRHEFTAGQVERMELLTRKFRFDL